MTRILLFMAVLICLVLFFPASYRADVLKRGNEFTVNAAVSWLFRFIALKIAYSAGGKAHIDLRVAGISVLPLISRILNRRKKKGAGNGNERRIRKEAAKKPTVPPGKKISVIGEGGASGPKAEVIEARKQNPLHRIVAHVAAWIGKLKKTFSRIMNAADFMADWFEYLTSDSFSTAKDVLFKEGMSILRHVLPRKISGYLRFGADDPAVTGMLFGAASVLFPMLPETFTVQPEFCGSCLEADLSLAGRIFLIVPIVHAVRILKSKDVRLLIKRIRNMLKKDKKQNSSGRARKGRGMKWRKTRKTIHFRTT